ncbi:FecR family protein [Pedobacter sp. AW31-3R]|uniref:FecR family protein n=1 Tax=Pedobacter sp. AW31-3R TaxID=3445781 RepID=UPI003FA15B8C
MDKADLILIADRVAEGTATEQERAIFLFHVNSYARENPIWDRVPLSAKNEIGAQLRKTIEERINLPPKLSVKKAFTYWRSIAAAIFLLITSGLYYASTLNKSTVSDHTGLVGNDISAGHNGATLKLASGELVDLSAAKSGVQINPTQLTYNDGSSLATQEPLTPLGYGEAADKTLEISTGLGQTYRVDLSDGTKVWLNAGSSISFPRVFDKAGARMVKLSGEGYFEVAKDNFHPFIVKSDRQEIKVLGTHFNINAYEDDKVVKTTLLEGSVQVFSHHQSQLLVPGQQSNVSALGITIAQRVDLEDVVSWKEGYFKFDDSLEEIMVKISRWYNIEVEYRIKPDPGLTFSGEISRSRNISGILKMLEYNGDVHFIIEGRRVIVTK